jgi:hypothetical protein
LAFSFTCSKGSHKWINFLFLSTSKDANHMPIYHIHLTKDGKVYELKYSNVDSAFDLIKSIIQSKFALVFELGPGYVSVNLVLHNKNGGDCVEFTKVASSVRGDLDGALRKLASLIQEKFHLLDVMDVVEG